MGFRGIIDKDQHLDSTNLYKNKDDCKVAGLRLRASILQFVSIYATERITRAIQWPSTGLHNSTAIERWTSLESVMADRQIGELR